MLNDDAVFKHRDLGVTRARVGRLGANPVAHHHHPLDRLATSQELGLTQHRWAAPSGVTPVAAALPLGFQPCRAVYALDLVATGIVTAIRVARLAAGAGGTLVYDRVGRVIRGRPLVAVITSTRLAAPAPAPTPAGAVGRTVVVVAVVRLFGVSAVLRLAVVR